MNIYKWVQQFISLSSQLVRDTQSTSLQAERCYHQATHKVPGKQHYCEHA
jgi:hypothetical protein